MKLLHTQTTALLKKLFKFERCGKYDEALAELKDIWEDTTTFPDVEEYKPRIAAEIILRCGSLIGFLGHIKQIPNSQEKSKNLLTEARNRFLDIYDAEKIAECENYLALAYWRTGELIEAETWIEEALSRNLPNSSNVKIYSILIESMILIANEKCEEAALNLETSQADFQKYGDAFLNGNFYLNLGAAYEKLHKTFEALKYLKLAGQFFQKSGNQIYLGAAENNLAQLYKLENKFCNAHKTIDNAIKIFKKIKDKTREGFSFDTKAQIYFSEGKYEESLTGAEKAIDILKKGENKKYLVESFLTKVKALIYLDDFLAATFCLVEAIQTANTHISEKAAENLIKEYEITLQKKNSTVIEEIFSDKEITEEILELLLPPSISHYHDFQGIWIKNNHLESVGLRKDSLAIVAQEKIKRGDLVAITEIANDSVSCGFYDSDFGIVCLEGANSETQLFDVKDIKILGKIVGVCKPEKSADGKTIVEQLNI